MPAALRAANSTPHQDYPPQVKPIIEKRCMVCHGCYDAPCQLKMDDWIGLNRGASKNKVYDGTRLITANMTRLYEDALTEEQWREKGFFPVLERDDITQSVMYKMLALKEKYPLPTEGTLPDKFDFSLDRDQSCPSPKQFGLYNQNRPYQGMPYGFPGIDPDNMAILASWLNSGAPGADVPPRPPAELAQLNTWEAFLNGDSNKQRLMARYIYEHLFIGNLYFSDLTETSGWYRMVRSRTPPGQPIDIIASRRPYDDPDASPFYYRLQLRQTAILDKRHMPYALNEARMARWQSLFLDPDYEVTGLPGYEGTKSANPFITFEQLPVDARYTFMLDEAHFTIMAYIKGPVCRGQVALNVIDDHFWVAFTRPNNLDPEQSADFLAKESVNMRLPQPKGSLIITLLQWDNYAKAQKAYLRAEAAKIAQVVDGGVDLDMNLIWDGGPRRNDNASLTVFRHGDSASVVKGLVGQQPKTMWVIDYSLLERIHYLLVAGFDVYGNVGHQLESRLYMDFLRMEGEQNFLLLLPEAQRVELRSQWYRGAEKRVQDFLLSPANEKFERYTSIIYRTDDPKRELMNMFKRHIPTADDHHYKVDIPQLGELARQQGVWFSYLPELSFVQVLSRDGSGRGYSLIHNRAHTNNAQMFDEDKRLIPAEDTLTVTGGFIGSYPNMFFQVTESQLTDFTRAIQAMKSDADYTRLIENYGVRRTAPWFWRLSDEFYSYHKKARPLEAGLFDLNRYQNR